MTLATRARISLVVVLTTWVAACGGGGTTTAPTPTAEGFLTGRWTGTITITRAGVPDSVAQTEWQLTELANTGGAGYAGTATIHDVWLPVTVTLTTTVLPPAPGGAVSTSGFYGSPRGCTAEFWSATTSTATQMSGTIGGVDCLNVDPGTFHGSISLTKAR